MKTDFTGMSPKEVAEAVSENINERASESVITRLLQVAVTDESLKESATQPSTGVVRHLLTRDVIDLTKRGATPEEISALLIAHNEPQLAKVITTTGILDNMDSTARAVWLASMLPQQPTAEITLGR